MIGWIETHGIEALIFYYIFAAVTGGMPTPLPTSGMFYQWAFRSLNILNANVARLVATQLPNSKAGQYLNPQ